MADENPPTDTNVPPTVSPNSPPVPNSSPPADTPPSVPEKSHGDNVTRDDFNGLVKVVEGLVSTISQLVDANPISDQTPVKPPWTHRGKW